MQTVSVTTHGRVQAVQLPEGLHIEGNEVYAKRVGRSILLIPKDTGPWDLMAASLEQFTDDFMSDRSQPLRQARETVFE